MPCAKPDRAVAGGHSPMTARVGLVILPALFVASVTLADTINSAYTTLDFDADCRVTDAPAEGEPGGWVRLVCEGYQGLPVHVVEDDLRMAIAYGGRPAPARWQDFFRGFSDVHDMIEWRVHADNGLTPFATIDRWFVDTRRQTAEGITGATQEVLVLSTVARRPGAVSCVIGYVDAGRNPDANELARAVVGAHAVDFRCNEDEPRWFESQ